MERSGRVVVGVDGSQGSGGALRWAAAYARASGARLRVVRAWSYLDQPLLSQRLDCLSYGSTADSKLLCQLIFGGQLIASF